MKPPTDPLRVVVLLMVIGIVSAIFTAPRYIDILGPSRRQETRKVDPRQPPMQDEHRVWILLDPQLYGVFESRQACKIEVKANQKYAGLIVSFAISFGS